MILAPPLGWNAADAQTSRSVEIALPGSKQQRLSVGELRDGIEALAGQGLASDRCGLDPVRGTLVVDLENDVQRKALQASGFEVVREFDAAPLHSRRTQAPYFAPDEIQAQLQQIHAAHPSITRLFVAGTTFEGRAIHAIEISDQPGVVEDEPSLLFNGQHHPREVATSHVALDVAERLTGDYGVDPTVTSWVTDFKTVVVPMVNPDGTQHVFDFNALWRKNRQSYAGGCLGVDLNRNYPYRWGPAGCGFLASCPSSTYAGPSAGSELETQAMIALAEAWDFTLAVSYHAFGRFIDYPYACSTGASGELVPEHAVVDEVMNGMADAIDAVDAVPRYSVYSPASAGPVSGDDTSWYYAHRGTYAMIVEVGTSFEPAFSQVPGIVARNRGGWQYLYQRLAQARIDVHVTDATSGDPLLADVSLTEIDYDSGELPRSTSLPFGRWTYLVPAGGSYTLNASAPGYQSAQTNVSVGNAPSAVNLALLPSAALPALPPGALPGLVLALALGARALLQLRGRRVTIAARR
ncbi:MAG: hypothetical protein HRU02_11585 [Myxococcales bacterium]|nr:hypothetical protein [Myxococcales bacterium]